jgi:hypothetical protein
VGSPLLRKKHGPVTTESEKDEAQITVTPPRYVEDVANLGSAQDAGSHGLVDIPSYISGYVDGEGCFTVSISPRPALLVGWEVRPSISVSQNADRNEVLLLIKDYFGCGSLRRDSSDRTLKWETRSLPLLIERIVPHFKRYPLLSGKRHDFELFADICERMTRGEHRAHDGLQEIVRRAGRMNPSGKRGYEPATILQSIMR